MSQLQINRTTIKMTRPLTLVVIVAALQLLAIVAAVDQALEDQEIRAGEYMETLNAELNRQNNIVAEAAWAYGSNVTEHNARLKNDASVKSALFSKVSGLRSSNPSTIACVHACIVECCNRIEPVFRCSSRQIVSL